jgi:hypothetical protein
MQIILMTSDNYHHCLPPFYHQFEKYFSAPWRQKIDEPLRLVTCGFGKSDVMPSDWAWYSIGKFEDYPANRWSDAFLKVLDEVAEKRFILMLEDYWLCRETDVEGVAMAAAYMEQYKNVFRFDISTDTLGMDAGALFGLGKNTYARVGRWDLLRRPQESQYNFSFWGSIFNRELAKRYVVPGESAQEIEIAGTRRLNADMCEKTGLMVLGTRQAPMIHGNIYSGGFREKFGKTGPFYADPWNGSWAVSDSDLEEMRRKGLWGE